jgi:hypothetical protein
MAEICVKAVLAVADLPRRDVNLDLIKVCGCYNTKYNNVIKLQVNWQGERQGNLSAQK